VTNQLREKTLAENSDTPGSLGVGLGAKHPTLGKNVTKTEEATAGRLDRRKLLKDRGPHGTVKLMMMMMMMMMGANHRVRAVTQGECKAFLKYPYYFFWRFIDSKGQPLTYGHREQVRLIS
jgi:hypothetical protein